MNAMRSDEQQQGAQRPKQRFMVKVIHKGSTVEIFDSFEDSMGAVMVALESYPQARCISVRAVGPAQGAGVEVQPC